jgi:hypothetical protein
MTRESIFIKEVFTQGYKVEAHVRAVGRLVGSEDLLKVFHITPATSTCQRNKAPSNTFTRSASFC